jgi:transcriptional regulator with XRE-family HTH domain
MDYEKKKALGIKLLVARRAKGLTQTEVAKKIGIHQAHYQRIEQGKFGLSAEQLVVLCYFLNVNLVDLTEIYVGVVARNNNDAEEFNAKLNKLKAMIRISEEEIRKRDKIIEKLKKEINGLETEGYGVKP